MSLTLLKALRRLRDDGPEDTWAGICGNLPYPVHSDHIERLDALFKSWPKFSGDSAFPVPGVDGMTPLCAFAYIPNCWEGEYGALRRELLDHCINELAKELE